jgi:truncated hemoglobin YjbI
MNAENQEPVPTLFEWAGGTPALRRMTTIFYGKYVPEDPLLGPLFADMAPDHPERVAAWLGEVFGGPPSYSERYGGYDRMVSRHVGRGLREEQRARWVQLLCKSADDAQLPTDPLERLGARRADTTRRWHVRREQRRGERPRQD